MISLENGVFNVERVLSSRNYGVTSSIISGTKMLPAITVDDDGGEDDAEEEQDDSEARAHIRYNVDNVQIHDVITSSPKLNLL